MLILRDVAVALLFAWLSIDAIVVFRRKSGHAENRDRSSLRLLMIAGPLVWVVSIGLAFTSMGAFQFPEGQVIGLLVMVFGIVLRSTAIAQLGRFHTPNVAVLEEHQVKATGLYRHVRHPSYLGALIGFAGFGLALGNWLSLLSIVLVTPAIYLHRIREEEIALTDGLGDAYRDYCRHTKRLIPCVY